MKVAVLCLCFISITIAWPLSKSKQHAVSGSSEEKYDARGHRSHRHHHVTSQALENLLLPRDDLTSPQKTLYSSEERTGVLVQERIPAMFSKSHEDPDDDVDDNDSNDTDESDEVVTGFPTDSPVPTAFPPYPFTRGDNAGRGDSVAYRVKAKAVAMKSSKLHRAARKLMVPDATEEDVSALAADSRPEGLSREDLGALRSAEKYGDSLERGDGSLERGDGSHEGRDSNEVLRKVPGRSAERDGRREFDSPERDSAEWGARGIIPLSRESREGPARVSAEAPDDNDSNQTLESAEDARDRLGIKHNEVIF